ncbi:hypothetical protein Q5752_006054 [Cryptotrichosporon argae]
MYIRPVHAELDPSVLRAFARAHPLGQLTTALPCPGLDTLQTTHLPFVIDDPPALSSSPSPSSSSSSSSPLPPPAAPGAYPTSAFNSPAPDAPATPSASSSAVRPASAALGTLRAHMARANPQTKALLSSAGPDGVVATDVLVLFTAPTHAYVSPRLYVSTKPASGKVVPTWDYAAVQVYGRLRVLDRGDTAGAWLQRQVEDLSDTHEARAGGAWKVGDAPASYVEALKRGIVGLEIEILKIEGRFKLSQEMGDEDWNGVVEGFRALGTEDGHRLAQMIEERGKGRTRAGQ